MNNQNAVKELPKPTRPSKTHEVEMGDIIKVAGGFTFKVVGSKKLTLNLARKPSFKEVDGSEKVKIWVCGECGQMIQDDQYQMSKGSTPFCMGSGCTNEIINYKAQEV